MHDTTERTILDRDEQVPFEPPTITVLGSLKELTGSGMPNPGDGTTGQHGFAD